MFTIKSRFLPSFTVFYPTRARIFFNILFTSYSQAVSAYKPLSINGLHLARAIFASVPVDLLAGFCGRPITLNDAISTDSLNGTGEIRTLLEK
jgi:hypothetical protein